MVCNLCGRTHETQEQAQRCAAYEVMLNQIPLIDPLDPLLRPAGRREVARRRERLETRERLIRERQDSARRYGRDVERLNRARQQRLSSRRVRRRWRDDDPPDFEGGIRVPRRPRRPSGFPGLEKELPRTDTEYRFQRFQPAWTESSEDLSLTRGWKKAS